MLVSIEIKTIPQISNIIYRAMHNAHIYRNTMYLIGGWNENERGTNEVWEANMCISYLF